MIQYDFEIEKDNYNNNDLNRMKSWSYFFSIGLEPKNFSVIKSINDSNMSSLNCFEEIQLSEKLIDMHKHFDMVRYAKTGGEANAIAIRLARAASGRDKIAICGYHGWHDWYLSANYKAKSLDNFLFKNIQLKGIPNHYKNQSHVFEFNNLNSFYKLMKKKDFCAVIMEVERNIKPNLSFLQSIRKNEETT